MVRYTERWCFLWWCRNHMYYMTSACWSPTRPGVFYTTKLDGTLDAWDLTYKHKEPVLSVKVHTVHRDNKKAQLSLTNPRDAKACQKLLQFDVHTTLSLTILAYLHSFSCCSVRNPKSREIHWKFKVIESMVIQGHWSSCQWKAHMWLPMSHYCNFLPYLLQFSRYSGLDRKESPAIADKPTRRESMPKIAPIWRAYNVVADNTGLSSFV